MIRLIIRTFFIFYITLSCSNANNTEIFELDWSCSQSQSGAVPTNTQIKFPYISESGIYKIDGILELIKSANSESEAQWDYYSCFQNLNYQMRVKTRRLSGSNSLTADQKTSLRAAATEMRNAISHYGAASYQRGAVTPFTPGRRMEERIDQTSLSDLNWCGGRTKDGTSKLYLDERVINQHLQSGVASINYNEKLSSEEKNNCLEKLAKTYAGLLKEASLSDEQCKQYPLICEERESSIESVLSKLSLTPGLDQFFLNKDVLILQCLSEVDDVNNLLSNILTSLDQITSCVPLEIGEARDVSGNLGSGLTSSYHLKRERNRNGVPQYRVNLALHFLKADGEEDQSLQDDYLKQSSGCLAEHQELFNGPNGEVMKIELSPPEGRVISGVRVPISTIKIADSPARSNSLKWSPEIDCPTIIHELLHLLGLVDEYHEHSKGVIITAGGEITRVESRARIKSFDCRSLGPSDSIMFNQADAIKSASKDSKQIEFCSCSIFAKNASQNPGGLNHCLNSIQAMSTSSNNCPGGSSLRSVELFENEFKENRREISMAQNSAFDRKSAKRYISLKNIPARKTLFYPAQFRYITEPGCRLNNETYYQCAPFAYETSRQAYGNADCRMDRPAACSSGDGAWLR